MDPTGNFYNYRTALRGAAHRSLTAHSNREKVSREEAEVVSYMLIFSRSLHGRQNIVITVTTLKMGKQAVIFTRPATEQ